MNNNSIDLVLGTLVTDSFSLGAHWIYSPEDIQKAQLDYSGLNTPLAKWHKGKQKGDFTHYGDQIVWLYEYIKENNEFDVKNYMQKWKTNIQTYTGYCDGASSTTLENLNNNQDFPYGSDSHDLSVVGRIAPLLLVSLDEATFLNNVKLFVSSTHNNKDVLEAADFFARLLWNVKEGSSIKNSILKISQNYSTKLQNQIKTGLENTQDTVLAINELGSACSIDGAFQSTIYLINNFDNDFENAIIQNTKAGGDSSVRAMIYTMLMVKIYGKSIIPSKWIEQMKYKV